MKTVSIRTKLLSFFFAIALSIASLSGFLAYEDGKVFFEATDVATNWMPCVAVLGDMYQTTSKLRLLELDLIRTSNQQKNTELQGKMNALISDMQKQREIYAPMISSDGERLNYPLFSKDWDAILAGHQRLLKLALNSQTSDNAAKANQTKAAEEELMWGANKAEFESAFTHLNSLIKANVDGGAEAEALARNANHSTTQIAIAIGVTLLAGGLGFSLFLSAMVRRIRKSVAALQSMAARNLNVQLPVESKDEFGQMAMAVNAAIAAMSQALNEINTATLALSDASVSLVDSSTTLSTGTEKSSASLDETSASLEQITATVKLNADNAKHARLIAMEACAVAEKGGPVAQAAVDVMLEINKSSAKVADIISSIDDIAFQTNLLAVNAAVEAAHAGPEGRGFTVVAEEVRMLAHRTAQSARQIKGLIAESVAAASRGSESVNGCGETLREILGSITRVSRVVDEIADACAEQATGIDLVSTAISQIDHVTQQGARESGNISTTARQLADQAKGLKKMIGAFVIAR
jgi:methyl-accepting chemotaxis protein